MYKKFALLTLVLSILFQGYTQDKRAKKYAKTISESDLKKHLEVLSADSLEGRETAMAGGKKAAAYIANHFEQLGLTAPVDGSFYQSFGLKRAVYNEVYVKRGEEIRRNFEHFIYFTKNETYGEEYIDVIFAGYGDSQSLKSLELEGKYVAFINREWSDFRAVIAALKKSKAAGYFVIIEDPLKFQFVLKRYGGFYSGAKMDFEFDQSGSKIAVIGTEMAGWIFERPFDELKESSGVSAELLINVDMHVKSVTTENVLGLLKGTEKPEEILVITAHYDHEGIINGEIYNGADDDGSGTTVVMELAEAFTLAAKKGIKPKRSILFMTVSGEEKGLLGSEYYSENPVFPLENTITNLNIDMVGRVDEKHAVDPFYVYVIGSDKLSQELHDIGEKANDTYTHLNLDYEYNADDDPNRYYYRSDHYNFAKNGIPVIFYFNGSHEDYHKPTDSIEKIRFDVMKKRAELVFYTAWELANRENRVKLNSKE